MEVLEIKIHCVCGERYKFDVQPLEGRMPNRVECPFCGVDGTEAADSFIAAYSGAQEPLAASSEPGVCVQTKVSNEELTHSRCHFGPGMLGAALGAAVGMLAWYFLAIGHGTKLAGCAIAVGLLSGYGGRWLGQYPHRMLGLIAACCTFVSIFGCYYLQTRAQASANAKEIDEMFFEELLSSRDLVALIPDGTDPQIIKYLTLQLPSGHGVTGVITAKEIEDFRKHTWEPAYDLASGKIDLAHYREHLHIGQEPPFSDFEHFRRWLGELGVLSIAFLAVGMLVAYKLGAGEG